MDAFATCGRAAEVRWLLARRSSVSTGSLPRDLIVPSTRPQWESESDSNERHPLMPARVESGLDERSSSSKAAHPQASPSDVSLFLAARRVSSRGKRRPCVHWRGDNRNREAEREAGRDRAEARAARAAGGKQQQRARACALPSP